MSTKTGEYQYCIYVSISFGRLKELNEGKIISKLFDFLMLESLTEFSFSKNAVVSRINEELEEFLEIIFDIPKNLDVDDWDDATKIFKDYVIFAALVKSLINIKKEKSLFSVEYAKRLSLLYPVISNP